MPSEGLSLLSAEVYVNSNDPTVAAHLPLGPGQTALKQPISFCSLLGLESRLDGQNPRL